jgi:hypothetical protein
MNESSLDSERVKRGIKEGGKEGILPESKLPYSSSLKSSPVMLKSLIWESCTDKSFN